MQARISVKDKKTGVSYAVTDDGRELPVINVTHPAFKITLSDSELNELLQKHLKDLKRQEKAPAFIRRLLIGYMQRHSSLMRAISAAAGTYLGGINTYIMKLGPDNLDDSYATDLDRKLTASLPVLAMRLRLQDITHLLAEGLTPALAEDSKAALHFVNIGGGTAIDSLNALILLQKKSPDLLAGRPIFIHLLDLDEAGPNFGARALASLQAENGPLHGLEVRFDHVSYDWSKTMVLRGLLNSFNGQGVIMAASSEGALFEYGSDEEITGNLRTLHEAVCSHALVAGTVTRADELGRLLNSGSQAALNLRGLEAFASLAGRAGWKITKRMDRPLSHDILMEPQQLP
jgi:hypothetical protein